MTHSQAADQSLLLQPLLSDPRPSALLASRPPPLQHLFARALQPPPTPTHPPTHSPRQAIGNEMDVTLVDLDRLLPPATVMVVTVTATTTSGKPLSEEDLA